MMMLEKLCFSRRSVLRMMLNKQTNTETVKLIWIISRKGHVFFSSFLLIVIIMYHRGGNVDEVVGALFGASYVNKDLGRNNESAVK